MTDEVRCPQCGARNGADADWCTQCYTRLDDAPTPGVGGTDDHEAAADEGAPPPPPGGEPRPLRSGDGRFRQTEDGLEWCCGTCGEWNSIERLTCTVCATPFGASAADEERPPRPDVPAGTLVGGSLVLPGLGHWLLGLRGSAVLRGLLALVWGLGGVTLFLRAQSSGQSILPAIPLLLGWAVVAAGSANDAFVEGGGTGQRVLVGRTLLWLTIAVVGGTFVAVFVGVLSAARG